jgi:hypothetical protein
LVEHRNLTGDSLHEPKGAADANSGDVYVADGLGSGAWLPRYNGIVNINSFALTGRFEDISAPSSIWLVVPAKSTLNKVSGVLDGPITVANSVITIYKNGASTGQTVTVPFSGSVAGTKTIQSLSPVISFNEGDVLELRSDGGATTTAKFTVSLNFTNVS